MDVHVALPPLITAYHLPRQSIRHYTCGKCKDDLSCFQGANVTLSRWSERLLHRLRADFFEMRNTLRGLHVHDVTKVEMKAYTFQAKSRCPQQVVQLQKYCHKRHPDPGWRGCHHHNARTTSKTAFQQLYSPSPCSVRPLRDKTPEAG